MRFPPHNARIWCFLFVFLLLFGQSTAFGIDDMAGRSLITAVPCDESPDIDGEITDSAWLDPAPQARFFSQGQDCGYLVPFPVSQFRFFHKVHAAFFL